MSNGKFVISLDFELMWGVRDKKAKPLTEKTFWAYIRHCHKCSGCFATMG
ncbi:MAG: hypothetical protein R2829_06405 [Bacteroidia bacterium]